MVSLATSIILTRHLHTRELNLARHLQDVHADKQRGPLSTVSRSASNRTGKINRSDIGSVQIWPSGHVCKHLSQSQHTKKIIKTAFEQVTTL